MGSTPKPKFIFMAGAIASGKSTLARRLAAESNAVLFNIDEWVRIVGRPNSFKEYDYFYHPCLQIIASLAREILQKGVSVVLDFGGNTAFERERTRAIFKDLDCTHELYFLNTPTDVCAARFKKRNENPELAIREESLNEAKQAGIKNFFQPLTADEPKYNLIEVTDG